MCLRCRVKMNILAFDGFSAYSQIENCLFIAFRLDRSAFHPPPNTTIIIANLYTNRQKLYFVFMWLGLVFLFLLNLSQCLHSGVLGSHSPRSITTFHPFNSTEKPYTDSSHFHSIRMHIYEFICSHWNHSNGILFSWYGRRTELNDIFTRKMFHSMRIRFSVGSFVRSLNRQHCSSTDRFKFRMCASAHFHRKIYYAF